MFSYFNWSFQERMEIPMTRLARINEQIALWGTQAFGSMWMFWLFFFGSMLLFIHQVPESVKELIGRLSSNSIQLWALPLIMVGSAVLSKASEKRAKQDHQMLMKEMTELKEILSKLSRLEKEVGIIKKDIEESKD